MVNVKNNEIYAVTFYEACGWQRMFQDLVPAVMFLGLKMLNIVTEVALCCLVEHVAPTTTTTTTTMTTMTMVEMSMMN